MTFRSSNIAYWPCDGMIAISRSVRGYNFNSPTQHHLGPPVSVSISDSTSLQRWYVAVFLLVMVCAEIPATDHWFHTHRSNFADGLLLFPSGLFMRGVTRYPCLLRNFSVCSTFPEQPRPPSNRLSSVCSSFCDFASTFRSSGTAPYPLTYLTYPPVASANHTAQW